MLPNLTSQPNYTFKFPSIIHTHTHTTIRCKYAVGTL